MQEDQVLAMQQEALAATKDSDHDLEVCLNLANRMKLAGLHFLWVHSTLGYKPPEDFEIVASCYVEFLRLEEIVRSRGSRIERRQLAGTGPPTIIALSLWPVIVSTSPLPLR